MAELAGAGRAVRRVGTLPAPTLTGFLIVAVLAPVVGEAIRQLGPVVLASRREFDDLMDGLTFGVISGVARSPPRTPWSSTGR